MWGHVEVTRGSCCGHMWVMLGSFASFGGDLGVIWGSFGVHVFGHVGSCGSLVGFMRGSWCYVGRSLGWVMESCGGHEGDMWGSCGHQGHFGDVIVCGGHVGIMWGHDYLESPENYISFQNI